MFQSRDLEPKILNSCNEQQKTDWQKRTFLSFGLTAIQIIVEFGLMSDIQFYIF